MKIKFFTLLALCMSLSVVVVKAANKADQTINLVTTAPNWFFAASPNLCTWENVQDPITGNKVGRFTRPSTATLTDGPQWGYVDRTLGTQLLTLSISGGSYSMSGTAPTTSWQYVLVRMKKSTTGAPQLNFQGSGTNYLCTVTSSTSVVVGQWVSYLFDINSTNSTNKGTYNYKMLTIIPDNGTISSVTDIDNNVYLTVTTPYTISVSANDASMGTVSGGGSYMANTTVTLNAIPNPGYHFVNWTDGVGAVVSNAGASYTFTASAAKTLVANFVTGGYNINATSNGAGGTVTGLATNGSYAQDAAVSLTATANTNYRFLGWVENGNFVNTSSPYNFTAIANRTLVAAFGATTPANYTSAASLSLSYTYGAVGGGTPVYGSQGSIALDYVGLTNPIVINQPTNFEVSTTNNTYTGGSISLTQTGGKVQYKTIYVHLKEGLAAGTYSESLLITSNGSTLTTITLNGTVSKRNIVASGATTAIKTYDGTTTATLTGGTLSPILNNDDVSLTGTASFSDALAGQKLVTPGLTGTKAANYSAQVLISSITAKALTITATGPSMTYGTALTAGTSTTNFTHTGEISGEAVTSVTLTPNPAGLSATTAAGTAYTVTPSLATGTGGFATGNYTITYNAYTGSIAKKALTITDLSGVNKTYDGTNTAVITGTAAYSGLQNSETFTVTGTPATTFADANVANNKTITVTGYTTPSTNYTITQPTGLSANITPLGLTVSSPTATSKSYDGNANITVSGTLVTPIGGDDVSINTTGTVPDANVGAGKTVTMSLTGAKAGNYSLTQPSPAFTADINGIPLTLSSSDSWSNSGTWSSAPNAGTDITVTSGELTIDQNPAVHSITVNSGAKLTLNSGNTLSAGKITLQNTATYVDKNTYTVSNPAPVISAAVSQTLTSGRNWYVSSPITTSTGLASQLSTATSVVGYNETTGLWDTQTGALTAGKGYISVSTSTNGDIAFNGTLNTGDVPITLSRSGTNASKPGFNLVGNPYPSYIDWTEATANAANVLTTIWYRTVDTGQYTFYTYNPVSDIAAPSTAGLTSYIPPMQAFWVRVKDSNGGTLTFTNTMRAHDLSGGTNPLKAPAANKSQQQVLRLQVSNGTNSDEAVVLFNPNASDGFDSYDSPKMSNANPAIPEIYTTVGTERLVINGLNTITTNPEIALGFTPGASNNNFTIRANQASNFDAGTRIILKDNETGIEQEITDGSAYNFASSATQTATRFSILFKSVSLTTAIGKIASDNENNEGSMYIYRNENNQIVVNRSKMIDQEGIVSVSNLMGQKLFSTSTKGTITIIDMPYTSGVYLVTVTTVNKQHTKRIFIN